MKHNNSSKSFPASSIPESTRATTADLQSLHALALCGMVYHCRKPQPSAEMLQQARLFLFDNGYAGSLNSPKVIRQLDKLHAAYLAGLAASLAAQPPISGAVLAEVRVYIEQATAQREAGQHAAAALSALPASGPFRALQ